MHMSEQRITDPRLSSAMARQRGQPVAPEPGRGSRDANSGVAAMTDARMAVADGGPDDLPRTFRRERDAQREQRDREARERAAVDQAFAPPPEPAYAPEPASHGYEQPFPVPYATGIVTALQIPFFKLMMFFIKSVFAAIPAIIILGMLLWGAGQLLTTYMPALLKMKILITFPN
jgi:hypothetical protein